MFEKAAYAGQTPDPLVVHGDGAWAGLVDSEAWGLLTLSNVLFITAWVLCFSIDLGGVEVSDDWVLVLMMCSGVCIPLAEKKTQTAMFVGVCTVAVAIILPMMW